MCAYNTTGDIGLNTNASGDFIRNCTQIHIHFLVMGQCSNWASENDRTLSMNKNALNKIRSQELITVFLLVSSSDNPS